MDYIVMDLEWNQNPYGKSHCHTDLTFEIIEIGAVRVSDDRKTIVDSFQQVIKPRVFKKLHYKIQEITHFTEEELNDGKDFRKVIRDFLEWCGDDYIFCTWGPLDLFELQRNMKYYHMDPLASAPIRFLDVQKLFSIRYEDRKLRRSLEFAIDFLHIEKDIPFHRAFSDAYYTARILAKIEPEIRVNYSFDTYILPKTHEEEIHVLFPDYMKYISREFEDKQEALADHEVISTKCYLCHKNLRKKIRWFTPNGKHYYSVSECPVHGLMKSKIRIRRSEDDKIYVVKTSKFITSEESDQLVEKRETAKEHHKKSK